MQSADANLPADGVPFRPAPPVSTRPRVTRLPLAACLPPPALALVPCEVTQPLDHFAAGSGPLPVILPQLGGYRVLGLLATGGMGGVYLGEDTETGTRVALKILDPRWAAQDAIVQRLLAEREVSRRVSHRGLVRIFDGARTPGGHAYLAMELLDGEDLGTLLDRGRLELGAIVAIGAQIADAVAALHDARIVHCDLKPDNVMVEYHHGLAGWPRTKVLDFGVARLGAPTSITEIAGTPGYMAPEQWRGHAEPRSDVYGLGCILYELITGAAPFEGTLTAVMAAHCDALPAPMAARRWIPEVVDRLVSRMLAKDPGMRPRMADVAAALTDLAFQFPPRRPGRTHATVRRMSDQALRAMLAKAVEHLRAATDLTTDEVIGLSALPEVMRTPEICYSLGVLEGAANALRATRREMLEELDLLTAPRRTS